MPDYDGFVTLPINVSNAATTRQWFADVLSFEVIFEVEGWAEVATSVPGLTIGFGEGEVDESHGVVAVFGVDDLDAARAELEAKGVEFDGPNAGQPDMVRLATFFDPDGNRYMLAESLVDG